MIRGSIARRYARALLAIGHEQHNDDALAHEVERLASAYERSAELRTVLENPVFSLTQRQAVLDDLARRLALSKTTQTLAQMLLTRGRLRALPGIARSLRELVDEQIGRVRVQITSAKPLEAGPEARLRTALARATGKTVLIEKKVDPSLIAGVVTQVGDVVYDGSLASELQELREHWRRNA